MTLPAATDLHRKHEHEKHACSLADFGLDVAEQRERFAAYRERFRIPDDAL